MRSRGLRRIGELVDSAVPAGPSAGLTAILRGWATAVGPALLDHAFPASLTRDGTLVVHCSSSIWVSELSLLGDDVLRRLRATLGDDAPTALRFKLGPVPRSRSASTPAPRLGPAAIPRAVATRARRLAAAIEDPEVRAAAEAAIASSLAREQQA